MREGKLRSIWSLTKRKPKVLVSRGNLRPSQYLQETKTLLKVTRCVSVTVLDVVEIEFYRSKHTEFGPLSSRLMANDLKRHYSLTDDQIRYLYTL